MSSSSISRGSARKPALAIALGMCVVRQPLLAAGFTLVALGLVATAHGSLAFGEAWRRAADHAYAVLSLFGDLPALALLALAMRREGGRLGDLLRDPPQAAWRTLAQGVMVFALMAIPFALLPPLATALFGAQPYPPGLTAPPLWVALWTVMVFPFTTAPTEELTYRAYALPRLAGRLGPIAAVALTAIGFGATHVLIPPVGSPATLLARFATLTVIGVLLEVLFLRLGRIKPLIIGHLMIDMLLIGGFALKAALN